MKLELKHLSPYLPYALGFMHQDEIYQLMQLNIKYDQKPMWIEGWNGKDLINVFPEGCQPILRPLSDLTEKINLHDDFFAIPIENMTGYKLDGNISVAPTTVRYLYGCSKGEIEAKFLDYWVIVQLLEWHFDIFNLIENNLAIDINNLK